MQTNRVWHCGWQMLYKTTSAGTVVRYVTASTMTCYQDLSVFERGVIVSVRERRHSIFEVAMKFGPFTIMTISRVYCENLESGKTSNLGLRYDREKIMQDWDR
ncbi:uncharacterized protein TNCV_5108481 [Trichonephila clavipes]|nr:uncharacterized protein TNCV_5108481 [Trichonephila clavipes]